MWSPLLNPEYEHIYLRNKVGCSGNRTSVIGVYWVRSCAAGWLMPPHGMGISALLRKRQESVVIGCSSPNSETICLVMDFQAIKEMDLKINSQRCWLGSQRGPLPLVFLEDNVSLTGSSIGPARSSSPFPMQSTRAPKRRDGRSGSSISNQMCNLGQWF